MLLSLFIRDKSFFVACRAFKRYARVREPVSMTGAGSNSNANESEAISTLLNFIGGM